MRSPEHDAVVNDEPVVSAPAERLVAQVNGITMSYLSQGDGPLVIFMHGFPDLAISWRHQMRAVADAGYRAIAPDMRGYGSTDSPEEVEAYSQFHLAGDITGLMDHLGASTAVLVGHDMGATLGWTMATLVPSRVRGVVILSVPHKPRGAGAPVDSSPTLFYQRLFQDLGAEESDLHEKVDTFLPGIFDRLSGSSELGAPPSLLVPEGSHFSDLFEPPIVVPEWMGAENLATYVNTFRRTGFRGALNWYRNIDRNWHTATPWAPGNVNVPASFVVGTADVTYALFHANGVIDSQHERVPLLQESRVVDGAGHWIAQERPAEVNAVLLNFLAHLDA
ncbi:alpha/beta fold hydrolase [Rhodococcus globerulus]|uniref:Alpha/beta hydrolase n=1 Tax=Rhodococcus globerulus TaxID=33008 RepID=A0ABU4C478_RHOGO|nr:alpha/beta hydrolase [Rhodococcus globerulus]MDV6271028.1 alpha/beta hydrolase [Rhodococcus globerulus]